MNPEAADEWRLWALRNLHWAGAVIQPDDLPTDLRADFEERAAIREYDGGELRNVAEAAALSEILQRVAFST